MLPRKVDRRSAFLRLWLLLAMASSLLLGSCATPGADPLPSWNEGPGKQAILKFVGDVTRAGTPTFVPAAERIAVFDNDGTLWSEQPIYFQFAFALDQVKALAPQHPEWNDKPPFNAVLKGDMQGVLASGQKGLAELLLATHTGVTTEEFGKRVADWMSTARHPRFNRPYTDLVYQPMIELLGLLRANGFKTYIVSGGTVEFMRVWAERVYGIPPEQIVGTTLATRFEMRGDGRPVLMRDPKLDFINDGAGKPVNIQKFIGRRPVLAFGNSDGDHEMLQWTAAGSDPRLMGLVHHTDARREWAYDRDSHIGRLDKALGEARAKGWTVVDMQREWKRVYAFEP
jgi:phosphoglycolate phosphatase-like HAD superfamily hydrolase